MTPSWSDDAERIRALRPRHVLFLCVANSARSQMAAAITRALAPALDVSSAGSRPTEVHPLAIEALADVGLDLRRAAGLHLFDIPADEVDVAITLCNEDVGAEFRGNALRVHWPMSDPTAIQGSDEDRLEAFRNVRDELIRRLTVTFGRPRSGSTFAA